jgi:hypothetical protein
MVRLKRRQIVLLIARKLRIKLFLLTALLSASVVVNAGGYFYGHDQDGNTFWPWCTPTGNYWTKCNTGSCPTGQSCPCTTLTGGDYQSEANARCAMHEPPPIIE